MTSDRDSRLYEQVSVMLHGIFKAILEAPERVELKVEIAELSVIVVIECNDRYDCARLIGMAGETIKSIRRLVSNTARRNGILNVVVDIVDPFGRHSGRPQEPVT